MEDQLNSKERDSLYKILFAHLVFIINQKSGGKGTGVLLKIKEEYFVITASHVINGVDSDDIYLDLGIGREESLPAHEKFKIEEIITSKANDFSILKLNSIEIKFRIRADKVPFEIVTGSRQKLMHSDLSFGVVGFPFEKATQEGKTTFAKSHFYASLPIANEKNWPAHIKEVGKHPDTHLLFLFGAKHGMKFIGRDDNETPLVDPHGVSGAPIWGYNKSGSGIAYSLAGIQTGVFKNSQYLVGVKIEPIMNCLYKRYPNLKE